MPSYHRLGNIAPKRHTQFRQENEKLYSEQVMGTKGFSGIQSILYHIYPPTRVLEAKKLRDWQLDFEEDEANKHRHFLTFSATAGGDIIDGRRYWLANNDVGIATAAPIKQMEYFFRNSDGDEVIFVHDGEGLLETIFGELSFKAGDYIVIPVGTTYRFQIHSQTSRFLIIESGGEITYPKKYRNEYGQLLEHSPYCERDIKVPKILNTHDQRGTYEVRVKKRRQLNSYLYDHHPCDVVGWDGFLYPWIFSIHDFEPITGSIHQPPPVHQTFAGPNFVICSFVPRMYDYHPQSIPAPYFHSNVNSDEVLYYVRGNFMSRKGIQEGSITMHPSGIPHGPQPGKVEASIGKRRTEELAVMIDTYHPLLVTKAALDIELQEYMSSWIEVLQ